MRRFAAFYSIYTGLVQLAGYPFHVTVDFLNISRGCGGEVGWRSTGAFGCQGLGVFGLAVEREPFRVLELPDDVT